MLFTICYPGFEEENRKVPLVIIILNNFSKNEEDEEDSDGGQQEKKVSFDDFVNAIKEQLRMIILSQLYGKGFDFVKSNTEETKIQVVEDEREYKGLDYEKD